MSAVPRWLQQAWTRRGLPACLLLPLALVHAAAWRLRALGYRCGVLASWTAPVPVLVVGNVVAGGAGKTPVTIALVQHLQRRGWTPGVVSRGYGRHTSDCRPVASSSMPEEVGDEPLLIAYRSGAPVQVAARRADAARALLLRRPDVDVIVCDDGLQHLALARDVEVLVTDDHLGGNGWMLPAGPLREPWPRRADVWLHAGSTAVGGAFRVSRMIVPAVARADGHTRNLSDFASQPVHAVAGIAHPRRFFADLERQGLTLAASHALSDHASYADEGFASRLGTPLICTEKDAVKLWRHRPDAWAVRLDAVIEPAALQVVDNALEAARKHKALGPLSSGDGREAS